MFAATGAAAEDWPQFRGPNGSGVSASTGLPEVFGPEKNVVWKTPLPPGHSSPVLTRDRVFVTAYAEEKAVGGQPRQSALRGTPARRIISFWSSVLTVRRESCCGSAKCRARARAACRTSMTPPRRAPVTDGTNVYVFFQEFGLVSYDGAGKERWRLPLGPFNMFYGFGASPILVDDKVILPVDQDSPSSYLIAVDKNSGRVRWKVERPAVISGYSTPTIYQPKQGPKQIVIPESFQLSAYSVADGKRVWWVRGLACEMKSIASSDGEYLYINGWGFPQNQPGEQIGTIPLKRRGRDTTRITTS